MKSGKRWRALQIIYDYLSKQQLDIVEITARDIINFHQLPQKCSHVLAATMKYVHDKRKAIHGFRVTKVRILHKKGIPTKYTIKLA